MDKRATLRIMRAAECSFQGTDLLAAQTGCILRAGAGYSLELGTDSSGRAPSQVLHHGVDDAVIGIAGLSPPPTATRPRSESDSASREIRETIAFA